MSAATASGIGEGKVMWSRTETAKATGLSVQLLDKLVRKGAIPFARIGRRVMFRPESIRAWAAEAEAEAQKPITLTFTRPARDLFRETAREMKKNPEKFFSEAIEAAAIASAPLAAAKNLAGESK